MRAHDLAQATACQVALVVGGGGGRLLPSLGLGLGLGLELLE